ncbi:protein spinster isoform X3 [Drosophila grimshawi]|uniref:protein spinster isoform X3 n=1 Tax=Drosophila grimshawi TaxID=7222 RepID=UPI000C86EE39|nr:protein spinster isoform X3 [Drosophila grimshawi]
MSQKHHQSYQPLPTAAAAMDNPAMSNSSSGSESSVNFAASGLPATYSSQQLVTSDSESMERLRLRGNGINAVEPSGRLSSINRQQWFTVIVLCFVNLINYMDRFTIAGVLTEVQKEFSIDNDSAGLLQTAFVISYMIFAPLFGYLGDRYSRRWLMAVGVALWSTTTLVGSFMGSFGWFITFRALVGIGEASYSTIAPTIISDLFVHSMRSKMLAMFYFAIPVGSGLGYIVGSKTAHLANNWRWALRVTPILGVAAVILVCLIRDPKRGESEGTSHLARTSFMTDIKELSKNCSFMFSTAGFTCVAFVTGALAWWGPTFIHSGLKMQPGNEDLQLDDVSYIFGLVAMAAGLIGVPMGSVLAQHFRSRIENGDPYICATGLFISAPMVFIALIIPRSSGTLCYLFVFVAQVALNLCWSIVADILLYVVVPTRRSTAEAFQILISHALGDAGSPYLVGAISVAIKNHMSSSPNSPSTVQGLQSLSQVLGNATETITSQASDDLLSFKSLQFSLFSTTFVEVIGGIFFLITACYIIKDKNNATRAALESNGPLEQSNT